MFGPDGFGGMRGHDGEITATGGAKVAVISHWTIRRVGTNPDGKPRLRFRAQFSWKSDVLMRMCERGEMKGRVKVFMSTASKGNQQVDIVNWDEWKTEESGILVLENVMHFDTEPLGIVRSAT